MTDIAPPDEPYGDDVSPAGDVHRIRFARFVARVLADARARGLKDPDIAESTGVGSSTFHRWQKAEFNTTPDLEKVRSFCEGLGVSTDDALEALGVKPNKGRSLAPEPVVEPEVRAIQRALADPNVSDARKAAVREMLRLIAAGVQGSRG